MTMSPTQSPVTPTRRMAVILPLLCLIVGERLAAQSRQQPAAAQAVYRMTPVSSTSDEESPDEQRLVLFSNTQPSLSPFTWQSSVARAETGTASKSGIDESDAAKFQHASHETGDVVQVSAQAQTDAASARAPVPQGLPADSGTAAAPAAAAAVETQIRRVEESTASDDVKAAATKHHQQAIEFLRLADEAVQKAVKLKAEADSGPADMELIRKRLAEPPEKIDPGISPTATVAELETLRLTDEARLVDARKVFETWESKAKLRTERKPQMPALIEKTTRQLAEARAATPAVDAADPLVIEAQATERQALITLLESQLNLYQIERIRYEALNELFPLQRDLALRTRTQLEKRCEFWTTAILDAGRRESARQAANARRAFHEAHPALRDLAAQNAKLTEQRATLQSFLEQTSSGLKVVRKLAEDTEADLVDVTEKEGQVGLTTAIGILLRNHRSHLPDETFYREKRREAESDMARLRIEQMPLDDEDRKFGDPAERAEQIAATFIPTKETSREEFQSMAFALLSDRQKYLDDVLNDYEKCLGDLADLDIQCRSLVATIIEFRNHIDSRVLWIRSAAVAGPDTPRQAAQGAREIAGSIDPMAVGRAIVTQITESPRRSVLFGGLVLLLLGMQSQFRKWITRLGRSGSPKSGPRLAATLATLGLTLLISSVWPGIIWWIGRRLSAPSGDGFTVACGAAIRTTAVVFWTVEVFRQMCRANGIAELHLSWPVETVRSLHQQLAGLMMAGLPFVFAVHFVETWNEGAWTDSLGRIIFVIGNCVLSISLYRVVRPGGSVFRTLLEENADGWLSRTRHAWSVAVVGAPLVLAGLSIAGFHYTAEQLLVRVEATAWLFIALTMAFGLLMRRMHVARRRLAITQARRRRAVESAPEATSGSERDVPTTDSPEIDFARLSGQVLKLVQIAVCVLFAAGAWGVWAEVLPALQVFGQVELWSTMTEVAEEVEVAEGVTKTILVSRASPVSLASVLLACGLMGVFIVASRNIPGLLELSVLQHLPMDDGGRNAVTTLCRYALFATGIVLAANMIGIDWSSVQWLLAALTVGLGFGLQEIFANLVSGLIILFERPVRIGDIVTIENVSGKVSRIQIRATTITDFDRKEYIVPNKEFVTGRVLNWTLSDKTNRIKIDVGVGYGNDTMLARALLVKVAKEHNSVMDEPEPLATFEGFGDSCLMLSLRCFIPGLDDRLQVITDLHEAIDREFKVQGLEIAFPQQDIHIRSVASVPITAPVAAPRTNADDSLEAA